MEKAYSYLESVDRESSNLIKGLQLVQATEGFVSDEAIKAVAAYFGLPEVEVEGVLSFYAQFKRVRPGKCNSFYTGNSASTIHADRGVIN